jgi:hypothetical protein
MKSWQKQVLQLGLPIVLDWIKSFFNEDQKRIAKQIKKLKKIAKLALIEGDLKKYANIMATIEELTGES